MDDQLDQAALDYHRFPQPGKISVMPTKAMTNQRDLSLAYSPGVAVPAWRSRRRRTGERLHLPRQPRGRDLQRHRRARARQHRRAGGQAGDGGQGLPVQEVRRHRRLRHRGRRDRPGQAGRDRRRARADLRRHQPRGHQGARVLPDRAGPAPTDEDPGLSRRPARHGHRRRRRAAERVRGGGQADRGGQDRLLWRGCRRHRLPRPDGWPRRTQGEHPRSPTARAWSTRAAPSPWTSRRRATPGRPKRGRWPTSSRARTCSSASRPPAC